MTVRCLSFVLTLLSVSFCVFSQSGCRRNANYDKNTLIVALTASPNTLDPRFTTDATGMRIAGLLFSSLVRVGPELQVIGDAASEWQYKDKVYTFKLRPNLKFSDGTAVMADDIKFSFAEYMSPKSPFARALSSIESVETKFTENENLVVLRLREFSATLLGDLAPVKILPKAIVEKSGMDFGKVLIGTGPFRFISQSSSEIRLEAVFDQWRGPRTKNLLFKVIRDDNTRYLRAVKGDIDIAQSEMPPSKIADIEHRGKFQVFKYPGLSMTYLLLNLKDPRLQSLKARQSLAHAINRNDIIQYKLEGLARPATSILSPANPFHDPTLKTPDFNLETARRMIREAKLEGVEFTLKTSNAQTAIENGQILANQLEQAGLKVKLQSFEWGTFYGDLQKGRFQLATARWVGSIDPDIYRVALHSKETPENSGRNRGGYANPRFDKLVEDGVRIVDEKERFRHYQDVQKIALDDLPFIPLWYDMEVALVHNRVKGYKPPRNGDYSPLVEVYKE